jgi:hypothetical protein
MDGATVTAAAMGVAREPATGSLRVALFGVGAMGEAIGRELLTRRHSIVGALDPRLAGSSLGEVLGNPELADVPVAATIDELTREQPDVVVHATPRDSNLRAQILDLVEHKTNVVSISGIAHLWHEHPELAVEIDSAAVACGVSVLGTGQNPGFLLDLVPIFFAGACTAVRSIVARRVADLSPYGASVAEMYGLGLPPAECERRIESGEIALHTEIGQSLYLIADALGLPIEWTREEKRPIVADRPRTGAFVQVEEGRVCGFRQALSAGAGDRRLIEIELWGLLDPMPEVDGVEVGNAFEIEGDPDISIDIRGSINRRGDAVVCARVVNLLPWLVHAAPPGLVGLGQIPLGVPAGAARVAIG